MNKYMKSLINLGCILMALAIIGTGTAFAAEALYNGWYETVDRIDSVDTLSTTSGWLYITQDDTIGWENWYDNPNDAYTDASATCICYPIADEINWPVYECRVNPHQEVYDKRVGSVKPNAGEFSIRTNHVYTENAPIRASEPTFDMHFKVYVV